MIDFHLAFPEHAEPAVGSRFSATGVSDHVLGLTVPAFHEAERLWALLRSHSIDVDFLRDFPIPLRLIPECLELVDQHLGTRRPVWAALQRVLMLARDRDMGIIIIAD